MLFRAVRRSKNVIEDRSVHTFNCSSIFSLYLFLASSSFLPFLRIICLPRILHFSPSSPDFFLSFVSFASSSFGLLT